MQIVYNLFFKWKQMICKDFLSSSSEWQYACICRSTEGPFCLLNPGQGDPMRVFFTPVRALCPRTADLELLHGEFVKNGTIHQLSVICCLRCYILFPLLRCVKRNVAFVRFMWWQKSRIILRQIADCTAACSTAHSAGAIFYCQMY